MARVVAYVLGVVYVLVGVAGFVPTGFSQWLESDGSYLLWFELNPAHNLAHLAIGTLLLWAATEHGGALPASLLAVGVLYLGLAAVGPAVDERPDWNVLALNTADHVLHATTGVVALGAGIAGWGGARAPRTSPAP